MARPSRRHEYCTAKELVGLLRFGQSTDVLVATGPKMIRVWDNSSCEEIWEFEMSQWGMAIKVIEEEELLLGGLKNSRLLIVLFLQGT